MTGGPATPEQDERFAALKRRFALGLAGRRDELSAAWDDWAADPDRARDALAGGLHRLAGAAGAYGFDALGRAARDLEGQVRSPGAGAAPLAAPFAALLHTLSAVAEAAAGER
ncbi:hypothetical protein GQ56_0122495 [Burkholderia paludis]|uniref:Hpt domain-containing protein n=1 Tax=Burkholderia paludis TaxID=1506587 RepID=UPI0004DB91C0|nr:Hpt domain-containing protein [Burkholderia paludis]KFG95097.1 hypothetical protein GQ56_0122495 [Burkholderia paludis]